MSIGIDYENPWMFMEPLFYLRVLTTTSVLSISLQIHAAVGNTLVESISGPSENHHVKNVE